MGWIGAAALGAIIMSPAGGIYFNFGPMVSAAGTIAWCASNPRVSTVITGASSVDQLRENLGAVDLISRLTPDLLQRINAIF